MYIKYIKLVTKVVAIVIWHVGRWLSKLIDLSGSARPVTMYVGIIPFNDTHIKIIRRT